MVSIHVDTITVTSGLLSCQSSMSNVFTCPINDTLLIEAHPLLEMDDFSGCDIAALKNGLKRSY